MVVTPWEVKGKVDYQRLIKEFGTQPLTPQLLERVEKHTDKLHLQIERQIFFSHRDLDTVLDLYDKGTNLSSTEDHLDRSHRASGSWIFILIFNKNSNPSLFQ
jgi:hypothetical protein